MLLPGTAVRLLAVVFIFGCTDFGATGGRSDADVEVGVDAGDAAAGRDAAPGDMGRDALAGDAARDVEVDAVVDAVVDAGNPLDDIPEEEFVPVENPDGVPAPIPGVYEDEGAAGLDDGFRALIGIHLRNRGELEDFVLEVSNPANPRYGQYMTTERFLERHAPEENFVLLRAWLERQGFSVNYLATNRLLIQFSGTVGQFNAAFDTTLHLCMRENPQQGNDPIPVYCTQQPMTLPLFISDRSPGIVTCDLPAQVRDLPGEAGDIQVIPPDGAEMDSRLTPDRVARAYNLDALYDMGYDGSGQTIGVMIGAHIHYKWAQTFWQSFGIDRANPEVIYLMEDPATRYIESQLDTTWAGALAPGADLIGYEVPDSRNTSMVFGFNEAVTRAQGDGVSVITTSFAHREDSEPRVVRHQYNNAGLVGAALGITIVAASGDSARPDTPSSSQYVTAVGGTRLILDGQGNVRDERAWNESGSGITRTFLMPAWQRAVAGGIGDGDRRVVVDVSAAAAPSSGYWVYYLREWRLVGGTSFSAPVWAGLIAVVNQYRADNGMAPVGYMNQMLYTTPAVQATFRDITRGGTDLFQAGPGWDVPTGWGTPDAAAFAATVPSP